MTAIMMIFRRLMPIAAAALLALAPLLPSLPAAAQEDGAAESDEYVVLDDVIAWVGDQYITQTEYEFDKLRQREMINSGDLTKSSVSLSRSQYFPAFSSPTFTQYR